MIEFKTYWGEEARAVDPDHIPWPFDTVVLFAFEGERVVGRAALMNLTVIEGSWVSEDKRGSTLAYRMQKQVEDLLLALGKTHSIAMAQISQKEVGDYLERFGFEILPLSVYSKDLVASRIKVA